MHRQTVKQFKLHCFLSFNVSVKVINLLENFQVLIKFIGVQMSNLTLPTHSVLQQPAFSSFRCIKYNLKPLEIRNGKCSFTVGLSMLNSKHRYT